MSFSFPFREEPREDLISERPRTLWRLVDPELRNSGVWRAEWGLTSLDLAELSDPERMRQHVERLVADWSWYSGSPYLGSHPARVVPENVANRPTSGAADDRVRSFRVPFDWAALDELGRFLPSNGGLLRVGEHFTEFQLDPPRPRRRLFARDIDDVKASAVDHSSPAPVVAAPSRHHSMWDRWLDG